MNAIRVLLLIALFTGIACAKENATQLAQKASESLEQGDFESAIRQYEQAQALSVDPRITYNKAIAHYRRGEIDTARGLFESVVGKSDQQLAARARYNIGNAYYSEAVKFLEDKNPTIAISKLSSAIEEYRRALTLNRKDRDARTNIELAYRLRKQLEQEQQQQDDQQQQDQQQQDEDQQDQEQDSQDNNSDQQQDQEQDPEQDSQQNPQDQPPDSDEQQSPQESQQDQSDDDQKERPDQQKQSDSPDDQNEKDQNSSQQSKQDSQPNKDDKQDKQNEDTDSQNSADENQNSVQPPEGELEPVNDQQDTDSDPQRMQQRDQKMTLEEARKMLQAIRDANFRRRLDQRRRMQLRRIPVDKDW